VMLLLVVPALKLVFFRDAASQPQKPQQPQQVPP